MNPCLFGDDSESVDSGKIVFERFGSNSPANQSNIELEPNTAMNCTAENSLAQ